MKDDDFLNSTLNIKEAAKVLGFTHTNRLSVKAANGEIPAFKAGVRWMFWKEDLIEYARSKDNSNRKAMRVGINRSKNLCLSARKKIRRIGTQDSRSAELEYKNQLDALLAPKQKCTKKKEGRI